MDIGHYYVGKAASRGSGKFFTVRDGDDVTVYEAPLIPPDGTKEAHLQRQKAFDDLRTSIHMAFVEPFDWGEGEERRVAGNFPNYWIEGDTVTELTLKHDERIK